MIRLPRIVLVMLLASSVVASAIIIDLDYTYDTNGFFDQAGSREALRTVGGFLEEQLQDNLLEINQNTFGSGNRWQAVVGLVVSTDRMKVYAGGRDVEDSGGRDGAGGYSVLGLPDWFGRVGSRGQAGELATPATDFLAWGGLGTFYTEKTRHFQLDGRPLVASSDFVFSPFDLAHFKNI